MIKQNKGGTVSQLIHTNEIAVNVCGKCISATSSALMIFFPKAFYGCGLVPILLICTVQLYNPQKSSRILQNNTKYF